MKARYYHCLQWFRSNFLKFFIISEDACLDSVEFTIMMQSVFKSKIFVIKE